MPYLLPTAALACALAALNATSTGFVTVDTYNLLDGTAVATECISRGVWWACGADVSAFAMLQYVPAFLFHAIGMSYTGARDGLVALNDLACLGVLVLVVVVTSRRAGSAVAACCAAVLLASPFLWYSNAGFGEPLAALAVTGVVAGMLLRWPAAVTGIATFFACVSKETAVPLLLGLVVAAWLIRRRDGGLRATEVVAIAAGGFAGVAVNLAFNVFRYGHGGNDIYLEPAYRVGPRMAAENLVALVTSPTAGLLVMWPAFVLLFAAGSAYTLRRRSWTEPGIAIIAVFAGAMLIPAAWYSPFGAVAWGPRLLLPWLPAVIVLFVAAYPADFRRAVDSVLAKRRLFAAVALVVVVTGLPQILATVDSSRHKHDYPGLAGDPREIALRPYALDATCPEVPDIEGDRAYFFRCFRRSVWERGAVPARAYDTLAQPRELIYGAVWCLAVLGLLQFARVRAQLPARA